MIYKARQRLIARRPCAAALALACLFLTTSASASAPSLQPVRIGPNARIGDYVGKDVMIPMRDGILLHAEIRRPAHAKGPLPILLQRSPYGYDLPQVKRSFDTEYSALARDGFIFVLEDIRGRFGSQGRFEMLHGSPDEHGVDEATDAYDSIAWAVRHIAANNGRVGSFGVSYEGWTAALAAVHPHPALKALSVQAPAEDMFLGDDFHHNGAFRLDYSWEYAAELETDGRTLTDFSFGDQDPYLWYLRQPSLDVAGWWDQEDFYGPMTIYQRLKTGDPGHKNILVVGPWNHGGWARSDGRRYGPFDLGSNTAAYFRQKIELPWFRYWLKGGGTLHLPHALVFETGSNRWRRYPAWPPQSGVTRRALYFHAGGRLSFDPPSPDEADADRFISDPADPVPYRARPVPPTDSLSWFTWLADDQAPFAKRKDVLSWSTEPLGADVTVRGDAIAQLYASTTGTDADWVVKLIDIYPSDRSTPADVRARQLLIADEVFRGRFRKSFSSPEPLTPGAPLAYSIDLHTASHVFKKGHRIAVQVQSSWFPLIDRNPQTFVPNILAAPPSAFKAQTHAVFHTPSHASAILVEVAAAQ